jgi:type 1 glutamine amidotransferase
MTMMTTARPLLFALLGLIVLCPAAGAAERSRVLLIGQKRDNHPPTTHEFMAGLGILARCLAPFRELDVQTAQADEPWPDGPRLIRDADAIVLYVSEGAKWLAADPRRQDAVAQLAARGGGLLALHWGLGCKEQQYVAAFTQLFGGCHGGPDRRYQVLDSRLSPADRAHPITRGLTAIDVHDEFYYRLKRPTGESQPLPLLVAAIDGQEEMVSFAWQRTDGGRSFGFTGLHFHSNWRQESYRRLITQGVLWTLQVDIPNGGVNVDVEEDVLKLE